MPNILLWPDRNNWLANYWLGVGYESSGQTLQAILEYQKAVDLSQGDSDAIARWHTRMQPQARGQKHRKSSMGDKNQAFEFLEKAYQERSPDVTYFLRADLRMNSLRSDACFQDLVQRMNSPK